MCSASGWGYDHQPFGWNHLKTIGSRMHCSRSGLDRYRMSSLLEQTINRLATGDVYNTSTTNIFQGTFFYIFIGIIDAVFLFK